ncbi:TPA: hypothetical protein EYN23_22165 [Candidatus Poribacteria bacterium]|nr:hypothetical protein [Candidatus Poribacteria bacterium]
MIQPIMVSNPLTASNQTKQNRIKIHILLIGLVLVGFNSLWVLMGTEIWHSTQMTIASLFFNAVFSLLVLVLINLILEKTIPWLVMSQADLQTMYVMVVMLTTISGHTMMGYLLPVITHAFWFASPENEWRQLFGHHILDWIAIKNPDILHGYYQGDSTLYTYERLHAWLPVIISWSAFVIALWLVLLALTVLLRKQWTENEKLSYPIVQLPIAMTNNPKKFFTNHWMWIGFGVAGSAELLNGLNYLFPTIPSLPIKGLSLGQFSSRPWSAMGSIHVSFYPFAIGLMFFTPLDLSFSCWVFYLLGRIQLIVNDAIGGQNIYHLEQQAGAWIAFGFIPLWTGRQYYLRLLFQIFGKRNSTDSDKSSDQTEPMTYRAAIIMMATGLVFLIFFCHQIGMSLWTILLFLMIYFPMVIGVTRIRAEVGPPIHQMIFVDPGRTMVAALGTRRLGTNNLTGLTFLYPFVRCFRAHPMPSELEAFRIAERTQIGYRQLQTGMIIAIIFGVLFTFWIYLHIMYQMGAASKARGWLVYMGWESFNRLQTWIVHPRNSNVTEVGVITSSFLFTILLLIMKNSFLWWPLHPGGYVLVTGTGFSGLWFTALLSWTVKATVLKIGGVRLYRKAVPFFLGLILGDYTLGCLWSLLGLALEMPTYIVWH